MNHARSMLSAERSVKVLSTMDGHELALLRGAIRDDFQEKGDQGVLGRTLESTRDLPSGTWSQLALLDRSGNWECLGSKVWGKDYFSPPKHPPPRTKASTLGRHSQPMTLTRLFEFDVVPSCPGSQPQPLQPSAVLHLRGHQPDSLHRLWHWQHDRHPGL